jgi:hypothetical protein
MGNQVNKEKVGFIRKTITMVGWKAVKNESAFQKAFLFYLSSYATVITFLQLPPVISFYIHYIKQKQFLCTLFKNTLSN